MIDKIMTLAVGISLSIATLGFAVAMAVFVWMLLTGGIVPRGC